MTKIGKRFLFLFFVGIMSVIIMLAFQHRLSYLTYPVHEVWHVENPPVTIMIKEVTIEKFSNQFPSFDDRPWYLEMVNGKPMWFAKPILFLHHFFSLPHQFDQGEIKVKGIVKGSEEWHEKLRVDLLLDGVTYRSNGFGWEGNLFYFARHEIPSESFQPEKITLLLTKSGEDVMKEHPLNMESGIEKTIFDMTQQRPPDYGFDPTRSATRFVFDTLQKGKEEVSNQVHPAEKENFPWSSFPNTIQDGKFVLMNPSPEFEGSYQGYDDVYSVHLAYSLREDTTHKIIGEQKIYLIQVEDQWKVIDLSPYREN